MNQYFLFAYCLKQTDMSKWMEEQIRDRHRVIQIVRISPFRGDSNNPEADWMMIFEREEKKQA